MLYYLLLQYSVPVIKYDKKGLKPRPQQLILTQTAAYVVEETKIKMRVSYTSLKGQAAVIVQQIMSPVLAMFS